MQKLQCELCGSVDIVKTEDNLFRCQHCGCKYTLEQAKGLLSETVTAKQPDFDIRAGVLEKYNGESVDVTIPDGVVYIGDAAFARCKGLQTINIPNSVKVIGKFAFMDCESIERVEIPDSVTSIESEAFRDCWKLSDVILPINIKKISKGTFANCEALRNIAIPIGVEKIEAEVFANCTHLVNVTIPESVLEIGYGAFSNCENLHTIEISDGLIKVGPRAFSGCKQLKNIAFPASLTALGDSAFMDCAMLETIIVPSTIKFGYNVFINCCNLLAIKTPQSRDLHVDDNVDKVIVINRARLSQVYRTKGLCSFCGGEFVRTGRLIKRWVCSKCGEDKDYY